MPRKSCSRVLVALAVFWLAAGCSGLRNEVRQPAAVLPARGVLFVADGAGDFRAASFSFRRVVAEACAPVHVETFVWSHGFGRVLADQIDACHAREEGQQLAQQVLAIRQTYPTTEIYLAGHSAGCAVVVAAAESLPPGTVDRLILLSPSLSSDYDLRPALCSTRQGVDVFYSRRDVGYLGLGSVVIGTSDRKRTFSAAGRVGFHPVIASPQDAELYARLRQHPWHPIVRWTGNYGGHYGSYQPDFLRAFVLPLLSPAS